MREQNIFARLGKLTALRLLYGCLIVLVCAGVLYLLMLLGSLFRSADIDLILFLVWIPLAIGIRYYASHRFGYLVRGAYVAVATEALVTGRIPPALFERGSATVRRHFVSPGEYDRYFRALREAFGQLRQAAAMRDSRRGEHRSALAECTDLIFASYLRDCCIGYTFYRRDTNSRLAASDALAIAYRNRRHLCRDAGAFVFLAVFSLLIFTVVFFALVLLVLRLCGTQLYPAISCALIFGILLALACKSAIVDGFLFLRVMRIYLGAAQVTVIEDAMYAKLCALSEAYTSLYEAGLAKAEASGRYAAEMRRPTADYRDMQYTGEFTQMTLTQELRLREAVCPTCGRRNDPGGTVCTVCGTPLGDSRQRSSTVPRG